MIPPLRSVLGCQNGRSPCRHRVLGRGGGGLTATSSCWRGTGSLSLCSHTFAACPEGLSVPGPLQGGCLLSLQQTSLWAVGDLYSGI